MAIAISTSLHTTFHEAVRRVREALAQHDFGVLTEIDVTATLKAKLGADVEDFVILGACNPALAHQAVSLHPQIGLLLPCNVVVRADRTDPSMVLVEAINPDVLVEVTGEPALRPVADAVGAGLRAALDSLSAPDTVHPSLITTGELGTKGT